MRLYTVNSPANWAFNAFDTFDRLFAPLGNTNNGPAYDVAKNGEDNYKVAIAVPGYAENELEITQDAKDHIIKIGYDAAYGARPLRRVIQNLIEDVLAEHLLLGKYEPGTTIRVDRGESGLDIDAVEEKTPVEAR